MTKVLDVIAAIRRAPDASGAEDGGGKTVGGEGEEKEEDGDGLPEEFLEVCVSACGCG